MTVTDRVLDARLTLDKFGKVRNIFKGLPGNPYYRLVVVSDRASIFNHVLNVGIPYKAETLNAQSLYWQFMFEDIDVKTDVVAYGHAIDSFLPESLRGDAELQSVATIVLWYEEAQRVPYEMVMRWYLTGSAWREYSADERVICGQTLPDDLWDGAPISGGPIVTPTTHGVKDEPVHIDEVRDLYPGLEEISLRVFSVAQNIASLRGLIISDTKTEWAKAGGRFVSIDERFTADSSRIWTQDSYNEAQKLKKSPVGHDKEYLRTWGLSVGIDRLSPEKPDDVAKVRTIEVPQDVIKTVTRLYLDGFENLVGKPLEVFLEDDLEICL